MIRTGISRQALPPSTQHFPDWHAELFSSEIPERDIKAAHAHMVVLAQCALEVVINTLALVWIATQQLRRKCQRLAQRHFRSTPQGYVFAPRTIICFNRHGILRQLQPIAGVVHNIETAAVETKRSEEHTSELQSHVNL